jgi:hypothetical protein
MANTTNEHLAAEAAAYLKNSAGAVGGFNGIQPEIRRQACHLVKWARGRGVFLKNIGTDGLEKYRRDTTEHVVYFGLPSQRVVKCTKPGRFGYGHGPKGQYGRHSAATPLFYLQRLDLMNNIFLSDLRLEGVALGAPDFENVEKLSPYAVTSQGYIEIADEKHPHPTEQEIADFMMAHGFNLIEDSCFNWFRESDGIIVTDAKPLNFVNSPEGIVPIDLILSREDQVESTEIAHNPRPAEPTGQKVDETECEDSSDLI